MNDAAIPDDVLLVRIAEAARMLGVSPGMVRKMIADGRLSTVRLGRAVRLRRADVEALAR